MLNSRGFAAIMKHRAAERSIHLGKELGNRFDDVALLVVR